MAQSRPTMLFSLPPELMEPILFLLDIDSIYSMTRVCKMARLIVSRYRKVLLHHLRQPPLRGGMLALYRCRRNVEKLESMSDPHLLRVFSRLAVHSLQAGAEYMTDVDVFSPVRPTLFRDCLIRRCPCGEGHTFLASISRDRSAVCLYMIRPPVSHAPVLLVHMDMPQFSPEKALRLAFHEPRGKECISRLTVCCAEERIVDEMLGPEAISPMKLVTLAFDQSGWAYRTHRDMSFTGKADSSLLSMAVDARGTHFILFGGRHGPAQLLMLAQGWPSTQGTAN